ncbi:MAG: hypothetical protein ACOCXA_06890, partial [Planctomycetota bacterium]
AWSWMFFPAAGYQIEAIFRESADRTTMEGHLQMAGLDPEDFILRPVHQPGIDEATSMRWWIHRNDELVGDLLAERQDLENEIAALDNEVKSPLTTEQEREEIEAQILAKRERIKAIKAELDAGAKEMEQQVLPALTESRFQPGDQILAASFDEQRLHLEIRTIEPIDRDDGRTFQDRVEQSLLGPEHALLENEDDNASFRYRGDVEIEQLNGEFPRVQVHMGIDSRFYKLFHAGIDGGMSADHAYGMSAAIISTLRSVISRHPDSFQLHQVELETDTTLSMRLSGGKIDAALIREALASMNIVDTVTISESDDQLSIECRILPDKLPQQQVLPVDSEESERFAAFDLPETNQALLRVLYPTLQAGLASAPINVTIPRYESKREYGKREYEYFFSSQILQIATDVFGILVLVLILRLERRGVLHRYGVEEDEKR